ncbi:related to nuclear pore complex protein Nup160 [Melanopsichium pennsylvanicum]|uniref:Related to nuclear pore complex protein Nup160 n=2 Tax=Melanopsichium pennsylvanicum TaxID=63383 RepID=A0AAJ4XH38_9BASI|nr:related to nuclear pore complex protein Nup160 [Melanopsichium pennsylvanicum 4]SNX81972.1 related to nuclear pore complex protein Nup160 [Melanopsichium pennsylvanicum]
MPLPYTPYKLAFASLSAPANPQGVHGHNHETVALPTPQHPGIENEPETVSVASHHAIDARLYFPSSSSNHFDGGYVLARVVAGGRELQLRWSTIQDQSDAAAADPSSQALARTGDSFAASLDPKLGTEPARTFLFPAPLLPGLGLFADPSSNRLYIVAVTTTGFLYRLVFAAPHLFHDTRLASNWSSEYRIQHIASSDSVLTSSIRGSANAAQLYVVDSGLALVTCADGTIVKLSQSVPDTRLTNDGSWKEAVLRPTSFLSGVSRFFGRSTTISDSGSSPTYALSLDVYPGEAENAMAFAASLDRKLRVWNLSTDSCIRTIDLPLQMESIASNEKQMVDAEDDGARETSDTQASFSTVSRPYIKVFTPGPDDNEGYALYVLAYIPASPPSGNFFALYGVELEDTKSSSGGLGEVTLVWQKRCDAETRGRNVELRDVAFTPQGERGDGWVMWALWDAGAGPVLKYAKVGVDSANPDESSVSVRSIAEDLSKDDWRTVCSERVYRPLHGVDFEATLEATKEIIDAAEIFLDRVLEPGRFSEATLRLALSTYKELSSSSSQPSSNLYASLRDEVASVVANECQLENDRRTGGPMYEKLYASRVREWMRFVGLAEQIETAARWPIGLSSPAAGLDAGIVQRDAIVPLVISRDTVALPVNEDEASIIERLQREIFTTPSKSRSGAAATCELANEERDLLMHAAVSHPTNILPTLGRTSATVAEVLTLLESASELSACFDAHDLEVFADNLQQLLSDPLTISVKDAIADLWTNNFATLGGEAASEVVDRTALDLGASLDSTLTDMAVLLSEAVGADHPASASSIASTDLGSALTADALVQTLASRHRLAVSFMLLLTGLAAGDKMAVLVDNEGEQIANALSIFQSLSAALRFARTDGVVQVAANSSKIAVTDSIVAQLNQMSVAGRKSREPHHFAAPTLLHQCVRSELLGATKYSADESNPSFSVKMAVLRSLWSLGLTDLCDALKAGRKPLLPYLNDRHTSIAFAVLVQGYPLAAVMLLSSFPKTPAGEYVRARALVQMERLDEASASFEKVVSALDPSNNSRSRAADGLFELLPSSIVMAEGEEREAAYYRHVALFFEPFEAIEHVIRFCQASIDAAGTYADGRSAKAALGDAEAEAVEAGGSKEVWFKIFRCQLALDDFEAAYATVMATPYEGVRKECLRNLVSVMCEEGHIQPLLHFTFPGLQSEVEMTLSFKARNSDPLSVPNYYAVLYSYHIFRGDLKSAGAVMYQHAERLGELHKSGPAGHDGIDPLERFTVVAVEQAQSYLASINAMTMLKHENAWFAHAADPELPHSVNGTDSLFEPTASVRTGVPAGKQTSSLTRYIPASAYSRMVREVRVISVDDVRREYTLALARLELVKRYPDLASSTTVLRPSDAVLLFVNSDSFDSAFNMAWSLGVDMTPIFSALTVKAVALSRAKRDRDALKCTANIKIANGNVDKEEEDVHPAIAELEAADDDLLEPEALFLTISEKSASWESSAADRAWRYLRYHLDMYDSEEDGKYYRTVLSRSSSLDHAAAPKWLTEWFSKTGNSDILLRTWIDNQLVIEAAKFATKWLQDATTEAASLTRANEQCISNHIIDTLLINLDDKTGTVVASRRPEAAEAMSALQQARKKHTDALAARSRTLKRQAEQDAFRQEKRREQQGDSFERSGAGLRAY